MTPIIKNQQIVHDHWQLLPAVEEGFSPASLSQEDYMVPLSVWQAHRAALLQRPQKGVWLAPSDSLENIVPDLAHLDLIAIDFPKFADGRGYSLAALLRQRYAYTGELRAIGDVLRDQLFYMARVGFDAFAVRSDTNIEAALKGLKDFSVRYQRTTDQASPLFSEVART